jgi:hypothetical protein
MDAQYNLGVLLEARRGSRGEGGDRRRREEE